MAILIGIVAAALIVMAWEVGTIRRILENDIQVRVNRKEDTP